MLAILRYLLLFSMLGGGLALIYRRWRLNRRKQAASGELTNAEWSRFERLSERAQHMQEALELRRKIADAAANANTSFRPEVDDVLRHLAKQIETGEQIAGAIRELGGERLAGELDAAETRAREATDEEARRLAESTVDRLLEVRDNVEKLKKRREELETASHHLVLELRNVHLAVLEAASSAGIADDRAQEIRQKLAAASDALRAQASAEQEVARLLARSRSHSTADR
jgi:hypothetical protein